MYRSVSQSWPPYEESLSQRNPSLSDLFNLIMYAAQLISTAVDVLSESFSPFLSDFVMGLNISL